MQRMRGPLFGVGADHTTVMSSFLAMTVVFEASSCLRKESGV